MWTPRAGASTWRCSPRRCDESRVRASCTPCATFIGSGVIEEPEWRSVVLPNAEARLADAIQDGFFALEAKTEFDLLQHFDTAEDLIEAKANRLESQLELVRRIRTARPPFVNREHYIARRLRGL